MKVATILTAAAVVASSAVSTTTAFQRPHSSTTPSPRSISTTSTTLYEYIPTGFTKESWSEFKAKEAKKKASQKNLGRLGPKGFQSRSFQSFQEALERGEATHLLPVMNAKERVAKGELKLEDIPYMQRGGAWDNSDIKGAKKVRWLESDKEYADGGYKKEQSVSIFGYGAGLDWTGSRDREGPVVKSGKFSKDYKAPNVNDLKAGGAAAKKEKKTFGLF